ncbi:MAG: hypothetical protein KGM43_12220 [Planctomycetota bacterium]|nr:hypothetical protein [Planctomycetota bacterium]
MANQTLYPSTISYEPVSTYATTTPLGLTSAGTQLAFGFVGDGSTITSITVFMTTLSTGGTSAIKIVPQSTTAPYGPNTGATPVATSSSITGTAPGFITYGFAGGFLATPGTQYFAVVSDTSSGGSTIQYLSEALPLASAGSNRYGGRCLFTYNGTTWTAQGQGAAGWYYNNGANQGSPIKFATNGSGVQVAGTTEFGVMVQLPPGPTLRVAGLMMAPVPHSTSTGNPVMNLRVGVPTGSPSTYPSPPIATKAIGEAQANYAGAATYVSSYFTSPVLVPGGSTITVTLYNQIDASFWYASQLIHTFDATDPTMLPFAFGGVAPSFSTLSVTNSGNGTAGAQTPNTILPFGLILDSITGPYVAGVYQSLGMSGGFQ